MRNTACLALNVALAVALAAPAFALTPSELQRLLAGTGPATRELAFDEVRESPWLSAPVVSRGTLHASAQQLEKRITHPRAETWRLLPDRIEWIGEGAPVRQMRLADAPALAALADALRHIVAGDLLALERDFRLELSGDALAWTLRLQPRPGSAARQIDHLELQGAGPRLQTIVLVERRGERTTTRIAP